MKDAFQKQHEEESSNDYMIGPGGKKVLTPEAAQRKLVRDRAAAEEVSQSPSCIASHHIIPYPLSRTPTPYLRPVRGICLLG